MADEQAPPPDDSPTPATSHTEDAFLVTRHFHVSFRGVIAVMVLATVCGMSAYGLEVKEPLYTLAGMALGFYFGQRQPKAPPAGRASSA